MRIENSHKKIIRIQEAHRSRRPFSEQSAVPRPRCFLARVPPASYPRIPFLILFRPPFPSPLFLLPPSAARRRGKRRSGRHRRGTRCRRRPPPSAFVSGAAAGMSPFYLARGASKVLRRITSETSVELKILAEKWQLLLAGIVFQYIHGLAARGVHYLHRPGPILQDVGFMILPELGKERGYISETLFTFIFVSFALWTFHPFILQTKRFYTVLIWRRVLAFLCASQFLRIVTFYSTQLPGPNYHCREGSPLARLPPPKNAAEVFLINFPRGVIYGCGDLIFSSHMIFTLVFIITYQKYGSIRFIKVLAWCVAVAQSLLIVASRKHYSVDVVVAWYTVNLVVFFVDKKLTELPDRSAGSISVLPMSVKDKDSKLKEENTRLLILNAVDAADRRPWTQMNGKHLENGNHIETETTIT